MATATLTKKDEYRREVGADLADARRDLKDAIAREDSAKRDLKDAKELKSGAQIRVNDLSLEMQQIEDGEYQPKLFQSNGAASKNGKAATKGKGDKKSKGAPAGELPPDAGAALPISELKNFGLSEKEVEKVANCPCHPKTIGEFEAWQRSDELWNTKIRGLKEAGITKLQDAHMALRIQYQMPEEADKTSTVDTRASKYPPRSSTGGEDCGTVSYRREHKGKGFSVAVAVGIVDGTYRSCTEWHVGKAKGGRLTPRKDSEPHGTDADAARAALSELVTEFQAAKGKTEKPKKKAALEIAKWRDAEWPESVPTPAPADAATDAPSDGE